VTHLLSYFSLPEIQNTLGLSHVTAKWRNKPTRAVTDVRNVTYEVYRLIQNFKRLALTVH